MTSLPQRIAGLSPEKRELLLRRLQTIESQEQDVLLQGRGQAPPIRAYDRADSTHFPLSFAQQRLWFLDQLEPGSTAYLIPRAYQLCGLLDIQCFAKSLEELVRRHESLRTTFVEHAGEVVQVIHPTGVGAGLAPVLLPVIDLQGLKQEHKEAEARRLAREEAQRPCDLTRGPLLRMYLLRLETQEHVWLLTLHHIITDGWSDEVLVRELSTLYSSKVSGQPSPLAPLPIQYVDYALWQRQWLEGEVLQKQLDYWKQQLAGAPPLLNLPTDRPRSAVQTFEGAWQSQLLSSELLEQLQSLSQQEHVTLFMTLLASFQVLLMRYSGQQDVVVGTPVANRVQRELESLIGFFVNTLVIRTDLSGNPTFQQVLQRVREVCLGAYAHQDIPFEKVVEELEPERDLSHSPLFQVMLVLKDPFKVQGELAGPVPVIRPLAVESITSKFDLTLSLVEMEQARGQSPCLHCTLEYRTDLFEADTIRRMLNHWQTLLQGIVHNPQTGLADLPLLTEGERELLLVQCNAIENRVCPDLCLHQFFELQVEKKPDAIALVYEQTALTYQELNVRANQLAHVLQQLGTGPDVLVAVCMERSLELVIALLGILKAGGGYIPLDPGYPTERLTFMLEDARPVAILTQFHLVLQCSSPHAPILCLDVEWQHISTAAKTNPLSLATPQHIAYMIYTSGSTGTPKGAIISHANVIRLFAQTQDRFHFQSGDIWTLFHSYAFDFSIWEMWGALFYGGRLVIVPYWLSRSPQDFYELLKMEHVTVLNQTPSAFRQLIQACDLSHFVPQELVLRYVFFGGDALDLASLHPWFARHGDQHPLLVNMYGITETTVHVTYRYLTQADLEEKQGSVIGSRIADLQLYVLDTQQQLVPMGVPGELYVGGMGLARGYWQRADLTAERFVPHPFVGAVSCVCCKDSAGLVSCACPQPGARLYRTGDLVCLRAIGASPVATELVYLGRVDQQVKLRGFRIELGEIQAVLRQHQAVQEAIVVMQEGVEKRLIAYVVVDQSMPPPVSELRRYLVMKLPEYMVPSAFILLETLPLTTNGKIDYRALPQPDRYHFEESYEAPRTLIEETLVAIWSQSLGIEMIGIYDNFFALGGDSMLGIQVRAMAKERGLHFTLQQLFQYQTIHELAQILTRTQEAASDLSEISPFCMISQEDHKKLPEDVEDAYPLTMLQAGMLFHSDYATDSAIYHDVFSAYLQARLSLPALQKTLQLLTTEHEVLRTGFDFTHFSQPLQIVYESATVPLRVIDISTLPFPKQEEEIAIWFEAEKSKPFDWEQAPLLRVFIHMRSQNAFQLTMSWHHAIFDGWSVSLFQTQLIRLYHALIVQTTFDPMLMSQRKFRDYVALEQAALRSQEAEAYWREQLSDATMTRLHRWTTLTSHKETPQVQNHSVPIPQELSDSLVGLARVAGVPLKSVLLAAHLRVMSLLSGSTDVLTGVVSNGRPEDTGSEKTLGLFLNTLPFRLQLTGGSWLDLIHKTFAADLNMLPFRRYPLAQIQHLLLQYPLTDRGNEENQTSPPASPDAGDSNRTTPNTSSVFALGGQQLLETIFNYTHFYAYRSLQEISENLQVGNTRESAQTNFPLNAQFSLTLERSPRITLTLEYNSQHFCDDQVKAIGQYYMTTLTMMVQKPTQRYEIQSLLTDQEQQCLLQEWNVPTTEYHNENCLHQLFEAQVARTPDTVALVFENEVLTYDHLNARSNQLAHALRDMGIGPDVLVGVCMERSLELVVALLAILKAGGAYVPLDPNYPQERLTFLLEDAQIPIVLTQAHLRDLMGQAHKLLPAIKLICLELDTSIEASPMATARRGNPACPVQPENLAYLIYTSGSTGQPKGAMNTHQGICNRLVWMQQMYQLTPDDRVLQKTPFSFDVSVWEFFWPLTTGACMIVASPGGHQDPAYLNALMAQQEVTTLHFVPSMLQAFLVELNMQSCESLRYVICSGETLSVELAARFFARVPAEVQLHNLYGPTEAAIDVTFWQCQRETVDGGQPGPYGVPIGRPIANTQIYLLDRNLSPVPIGVTGELYISGVGLARGYYRRPDLTAERFVANPFVGAAPYASTRLYRTGDLARYRADGAIEYLGRTDQQVKLRGFRIELGEIEATLRAYPAVQDAVVVLQEEEQGLSPFAWQYLVAYVVAGQAQGEGACPLPTPTAPVLQGYLRQQLPDYMVPTRVVFLETMPLTPNGKVDRKALPVLGFVGAGLVPALPEGREMIAPQTPIQERLALIWAELLHLPQVGIHHNFFELGGHSLLATQLMARIRTIFQVEIPLRRLFETPTIADIAQAIEQIQTEQIEQEESEMVAQMFAGLGGLPEDDIQAIFTDEIEELAEIKAYSTSVNKSEDI